MGKHSICSFKDCGVKILPNSGLCPTHRALKEYEQTASNNTLEATLIELYESAMLHGEVQANGVLPTQEQREQAVILALAQIEASYISKEAVVGAIPEKKDNRGAEISSARHFRNAGYNLAVDDFRKALKLDDKETT